MTAPMMMNRRADRPIYKQLADLIRTQIERGELSPGQRIPAESAYVAEYNISRDSVRRAIAMLRNEGLIVTNHRDLRLYVRPRNVHTMVRVDRGTIYARVPTEPERRKLNMDEGVPILVIERDGQDAEIHPADRAAIRVGPGDGVVG